MHAFRTPNIRSDLSINNYMTHQNKIERQS